MEETLVESSSYVVRCYNCSMDFDSLEAVWCNCLVSSSTLLCPSCLKCFCRSSNDYKQQFWTNAPQVVWDRKLEHEAKNPDRVEGDSATARPLVLVVDDERYIRDTAAKVIESFGYGVVLAKDGIDGLQQAKKCKPDLILTDMLMPAMEGAQLCRMIKADAETAPMKVVLMTSLYTKLSHRAAISKHIQPDDYVAKPLEPKQLADVLTKFLAS